MGTKPAGQHIIFGGKNGTWQFNGHVSIKDDYLIIHVLIINLHQATYQPIRVGANVDFLHSQDSAKILFEETKCLTTNYLIIYVFTIHSILLVVERVVFNVSNDGLVVVCTSYKCQRTNKIVLDLACV